MNTHHQRRYSPEKQRQDVVQQGSHKVADFVGRGAATA